MFLRRAVLTVALVTTTLWAGACGGDSSDPALPGNAVDAAYDGAWVLVQGEHDGQPIPLVAGSPITLDIARDAASGTAACNGYAGSIRRADGFFRFGPMVGTEMGCAPQIMASEAAFHRALEGITDADREGESLTLSGPSTSLVFALTT